MKVKVNVSYEIEADINSESLEALNAFYHENPTSSWDANREFIHSNTDKAVADVEKALGMSFGDEIAFARGEKIICAVYDAEDHEAILEW